LNGQIRPIYLIFQRYEFYPLLFAPGHPRFSDGNLGIGKRKIVDPRRFCSHSLSAEQCREGRGGNLVANPLIEAP
jgi:hypothetical protein